MTMGFQGSRFQDDEGALRRRGTDPMIEILVHKVTKMEASIDKLADAIAKLAVIEERQTADRAALERAFNSIARVGERLDKICDRIDTLEQAAPMTAKTNQWVFEAVKWCVVIVGTFVAVKTGLKP